MRLFRFPFQAVAVVLIAGLPQVALAVQELPSPLTAPETAPATSPASQPSDRAEMQKAKLDNAEALAEARAALQAASPEQDVSALKKEVEIRGNIDLAYAQIEAAEDHTSEHVTEKEARQKELAALETRGLPQRPPYSFLLLQSATDELDAAVARQDAIENAISAAADAVETARAEFQLREKDRRQAREAAASAAEDPAANSARAMALRLAELESQNARVRLRLRELELEALKRELDAYVTDIAYLQRRRELIAAQVVFDREALDEIFAGIEREEAAITQALESARIDLATRERRWADARQELESAADRNPALAEEVEARRLAKQTKSLEEAVLGSRLQLLAQAREIWEKRFRVFNRAVDNTQLRSWQEETKNAIVQIERDIRLESSKLEERRNQATAIDRRILALEEDSDNLRSNLLAQKSSLERQSKLLSDARDAQDVQKRLAEKLVSEIGAQIDTITWGERLSAAWDTTRKIWSYELTSLQDHPITVSKVVIGLILLIFGTLFARIIARTIGTRLLPRMGLNEGAAAAIQSLLFYLFLLTVVMFSLRIVNVPLTAFTILGGALAIGVGFGSQAVLNNFISGLILLAERPIRVGDLVRVDDATGAVAHIGPRSTRLRSPENIDYVIPNSFFLEKSVVNWTLYDDRFRTCVTVGVAYGSPTREVAKLLRKAVEEHGKVLETPAPIILFSEFGDNSLNFEVHFWVKMRRFMDRRIIESDIRFRVDSLFREAGITIAFPQRDIHLDTLSPLQVQVLPPGRAAADGHGTDH
ncbi:MAG: mechanosensitive ion channel domain-containing protein [Phycisphaerae bacterium]